MLAAHRDQENLVHEHQTTAAAKPLNQSVRGLAPKTPGNNGAKTGKIPLKSSGKGDENMLFGGKTAKANKNAFITPVAPRERAPLGAKTTNAKAAGFQTPGPLTGGQGLHKTQRPSASARKHKLKIHQPEAVETEPIALDDEEDEIPDVEYCPPKITELPDIPDDPNAFGPDKKFPQFEGENMARGWYSLYCDPIGEDGLSKSQREAEKRSAEARAESERALLESLDRECQSWAAELEETRGSHSSSIGPLSIIPTSQNVKPAPSTLNAKSAVAALSKSSTPSYAAPTAAAQAKKTAGPISRRNVGASHSTIGYSKGRKVSSGLRQASGTAQSTDVAHPQAKTERDNDIFNQLMRQPFENHEDEELEFSLSQRAKDLFEEELSRPFVLRLPDYNE